MADHQRERDVWGIGAALRERIRAALPVAPDGSIPLTARAWAVRGRRAAA